MCGDDDVDISALGEIDEFDSTEVEDFRSQIGDVPVDDQIGENSNE